MKNKTIANVSRLVTWIMLLMVSAVSAANGDYDLSWSTIDGGGNVSGGGSYEY
jgi:hypothetical protein